MTAQYTLPTIPAHWYLSRETHPAVAAAIHAISDSNRSPETIWDAPTAAEWDHVAMAVENYVNAGLFPAEADGAYPWGAETIRLTVPAA